jgi:hypothetical protein
MSRGPGIIQRRVVAALEAEPTRRFTTEDLAAIVYSGEAIGHKHLSSVRRALSKASPAGKLRRQREGRYGTPGYKTFVSISAKPKRWGQTHS